MSLFVPAIRVVHTGVYADGRPNNSSVLLNDVRAVGQVQQNSKSPVYVPVGGFVDLIYEKDSAFSFQQGAIRGFISSGVLEGSLVGPVAPLGNTQRYYQDNPGSLGPGTYAESFPPLVPQGTKGVLDKVTVRIDFPADLGEQSTIRLYRYRKTGPSGSFFYDQLTSSFVVNDASPWSWTQDISNLIIGGRDLDPETDSIAVSNVYTNTGAATMRALRVDFNLRVSDTLTFSAPTPQVGPIWP